MKIKASIIVAAVAVLTFTVQARASDDMTVRLRDGRIQEFANGSIRRTYGSNLVDVATDGQIVAGVTRDGRIQEFANGSIRRTYGTDVVRVRVSGGSVYGDLRNGRTAEFVNGSIRRTF